jgi:hypothetical protein
MALRPREVSCFDYVCGRRIAITIVVAILPAFVILAIEPLP